MVWKYGEEIEDGYLSGIFLEMVQEVVLTHGLGG